MKYACGREAGGHTIHHFGLKVMNGMIRSRRMRWVGHLVCMREIRNA
jgi:hypothetical protein